MKIFTTFSFLFFIGTFTVNGQPSLSGVVINEVLVNPVGTTGFDANGNGTVEASDEFVELYNTSGSDVDISGWELWEKGLNNWFTFPGTPNDGTTILKPNALAVVLIRVGGGSLPSVTGDNLAFDAGMGGAILNNGGDNLVLLDPNTNTYVQIRYYGAADEIPADPDYSGFPVGATRQGVEDWGNGTDGGALGRHGDGTTNIIAANDGIATPGTGNSALLPVELINFEGNLSNDGILLAWQTLTERNNDYFFIERSLDGLNFEQIGRMKGAGTSIEPIHYEFLDKKLTPKTTYYRLLQVDFDETKSYSEIISVQKKAINKISIFPNPANEFLTLSSITSIQTVEVIDAQGKLLLNQTATKRINISSLSNGIYFLKIKTNEGVIMKSFIKR